MSNNSKQELVLITVLTVALIMGLITVGKKVQDAKIKSIQQTIEQQFEESDEE